MLPSRTFSLLVEFESLKVKKNLLVFWVQAAQNVQNVSAKQSRAFYLDSRDVENASVIN